jgi:hypothetical protein
MMLTTMNTRVVLGALVVMFLARPSTAVPVDCASLSTLQSYIAAPDGCFLQDKLFTGFAYSGGGATTASQIAVHPVFSTVPGQDIHGFTFAPVSGAGVWTTGFTLGYTIQVSPPSTTTAIIGAKLQINTGILPNGTTATSSKTNGIVQTALFGNETTLNMFPGVPSIGSLTTVSIPTGSFLISLEESYVQGSPSSQVPVPEPATLALVGSGLLRLAARGRGSRARPVSR